MSDWDRFAAEEYELLVAEEGNAEGMDDLCYEEGGGNGSGTGGGGGNENGEGTEMDLHESRLDQALEGNNKQNNTKKSPSNDFQEAMIIT